MPEAEASSITVAATGAHVQQTVPAKNGQKLKREAALQKIAWLLASLLSSDAVAKDTSSAEFLHDPEAKVSSPCRLQADLALLSLPFKQRQRSRTALRE